MRDTLVEAIYEHGAFRPLVPVDMNESQRVNLAISDEKDGSHRPQIASPDEWAEFANTDVTHEQVREALSHMKVSLSQSVIDARGES